MTLKINNFFDNLIGDLQTDTITSIFGPPGIGKSTICFQYAISALKNKKKVIYIDTEGGFSPERIKQINPEINLNDIIVLSPKTFEDQHKIIISLNKQIQNSNSIGLVIVDSIVMLYRLKVGDAPQKFTGDLGEQLRLLTQISRSFNIPILVTNHVYLTFDTKEKKMNGGNVMEYWSKTIIELDKDEKDIKKAILRKHKYKKAGQSIPFDLKNEGLIELKNVPKHPTSQNRNFGFFRN